METQPLVTLVPWTFIAQICNLFIQVFLIKKFLYKPVKEMIEKRQKLATEELDKARQANEEANKMKVEYEAGLLEARNEANEIIAEANKLAAQKSETIINKANEEAVALKNKATADIEQEKKAALNTLKDEIGTMAMDIAEKVIEREVNEDDHKKLVNEFIQNVGDK